MFCNSDSCDSAIGLSEHLSRPLVMEPFYFLCGPFPLLSRVRGGGFSEVRTTPLAINAEAAYGVSFKQREG